MDPIARLKAAADLEAIYEAAQPIEEALSRLGEAIVHKGTVVDDSKVELLETEVELYEILVGTEFLMMQVAIARVVGAMRALNLWGQKRSVLTDNYVERLPSGHSKIAAIDAVANYVKHHHEWPSRWSEPGNHRDTAPVVEALGLTPGAKDNVRRALVALGGNIYEPVKAWAELLLFDALKRLAPAT
jgi:hypothetical protein